MAGAMRKMAVYLGLVEDDGYDGRGFDPDDEFEPEPEPERDRRRYESEQSHHSLQKTEPEEPVRVAHPRRSGSGNRSRLRRLRPKADEPGELLRCHPSHLNARMSRRVPR